MLCHRLGYTPQMPTRINSTVASRQRRRCVLGITKFVKIREFFSQTLQTYNRLLVVLVQLVKLYDSIHAYAFSYFDCFVFTTDMTVNKDFQYVLYTRKNSGQGEWWRMGMW